MLTRRADKDKQPGPGRLPWAALVFVRVMPDRVYSITPIADSLSTTMPVGYVLMLQEGIGALPPTKLLWGFYSSFDRTPLYTAARVVEQNLGIKLIQPPRTTHLGRLLGANPESHWKHLFCFDISESERDRIDFRHRYEGLRPFPIGAKEFYNRVAGGGLYEPHRVWLEQANLISEEQFRMTG